MGYYNAHKKESRYEEAFEAAYDNHKYEAILKAKAYLAAPDKAAEEFRTICSDVDLGAEDHSITIYAHVLVGADCPARHALVDALCLHKAERAAQEAEMVW